MRVLLSIKPEHVANILAGRKTYEFRRKLFARKDVKTVVIYCTMPVGKIVGEFDIKEILADSPDFIWKLTCKSSGISKKYFDAYFEGRDYAFAISIGEVRALKKAIDPATLLR